MGRSPLFARLAHQSFDLAEVAAPRRVGDAFDAAFNVLKAVDNRDEYIYKAALTHKVLLGKHSLNSACMLTEFRVDQCKADLVILNGTATVYEIKSERDSLSRLSKQLDAYKLVFPRRYVIAGENHLSSVLTSTSPDVGVLQLSNRYSISTIREARDRPDLVCPLTVFDSIRIQEAKEILVHLGFDVPEVPNTLIRSELRKIFVQIPPGTIHREMVSTLKRTRNLAPLAQLVDRLPKSLHAVALTVRLRQSEHEKLVSAVETPFEEAIEEWN